MTKHNFTPAQSETILNALAELLEDGGNAYQQAKRVNDMSNQIISNSIVDTPGGELEITLTGKYADKLLANTGSLSNFFFEVGDAISSKN